MGNVPISCCRNKSPRLPHSSRRGSGTYRETSRNSYPYSNNDQLRDINNARNGEDKDSNQNPSHILQHISEREPDDSETDPSSNPIDRPIFATRSIGNKIRTSSYNDSYSSTNSTSRKQNNTLTNSQDYGYNSGTSTNLTQFDGQPNDSFETSIRRQTTALRDQDELNMGEKEIFKDRRLSLLHSPSTSEGITGSNLVINQSEFSDSVKTPEFADCTLTKASSCSTIYLDGSTISQPDLKQTIKCVSLAIYYHIKNRTSDGLAAIFDEAIHPLKMPTSADEVDDILKLELSDNCSLEPGEPDQMTIYNFVKTLFKAAQLTSEYAITTLVYLERLITYAELDLTPTSWRRMFLGAILLSSKVWEDQAVWNVDYAQILEEISVEDINELERQFLELIQFNMNVPSSVYAKYYFQLRTLALKNGLSQKRTLLRVGEAKTLEALSRVHENDWQSSPIHRKAPRSIKRHTSLEKLRLNGQARAVLM